MCERDTDQLGDVMRLTVGENAGDVRGLFQSWEHLGLGDQRVLSLSAHETPLGQQTIVAGTANGIYRGEGEYGDWEWSEELGLLGHKVSAVAHVGHTLFASIYPTALWAESCLLRSDDGGQTWRSVLLLGDERDAGIDIGVLATGDELVCAGTNEGLFLSWDMGSTWTRCLAGQGYVDSIARRVTESGDARPPSRSGSAPLLTPRIHACTRPQR